MFMVGDPGITVFGLPKPPRQSGGLRWPGVRLLLLVNTSASSVTPRGKVVIQKALSADHDVSVVTTNRRDHATRLARGAANDGVEVVVVLGGDGTLNEAANGLAGTDTALAALPGGSTNVVARTIGLPNDPIEATGALLDGLAAGRIEEIGLGNVGGRYFLFHVGLGFDAAVVEQVERRAQLKRWAGHPLFAFSAVTTWLRYYDRSRPRFTVDGTDAYFAIVLNTNPYTYLGNRPFDLVPEATLDRGLAVVSFRSFRLVDLLRAAGAALGGTDVRRLRFLDVRTDLDHLCVEGHGPFPHQIDGDFIGDADRLELRHVPNALRLVLPGS
jgi:diacylglycerol kinase family enzyme